jgi:cytochrome c peroxidase
VRPLCLAALLLCACKSPEQAAPPPASMTPAKEDNPVQPLPKPPLGVQGDFAKLPWVTPEKVRLGKWLFYDKRLSVDGTVACSSCHVPQHAFSELTPHSTGVSGKQGGRKSPSFVNGAWPLFPVWFWDGRATSMADQAKGPIQNPIEMGNTHEAAVSKIAAVPGYQKAFKQSFGDDKITIDRIAESIAAYEATRLSGNSAFDRFDAGDQKALSPVAKQGRELFFGKAQCNQCHFGWNFTDAQFHNLGIGDQDPGRFAVSKKEEDRGAFKTPTLRDVSKHPPYMHDGSLASLRDVVEHYNKGGKPNKWLSKKVFKLGLTPAEVDAVVEFLKALDGEGYLDNAPATFP